MSAKIRTILRSLSKDQLMSQILTLQNSNKTYWKIQWVGLCPIEELEKELAERMEAKENKGSRVGPKDN